MSHASPERHHFASHDGDPKYTLKYSKIAPNPPHNETLHVIYYTNCTAYEFTFVLTVRNQVQYAWHCNL